MFGLRFALSPRLQRICRTGFVTLALLFWMADDGIGRDEFQCEMAVVHLTDCCSKLSASMLACAHGGCDSQVRPDLSEERARCLQAKSCDELVQLGACDVNTWEAAPACAAPCSAKVPPCQ